MSPITIFLLIVAALPAIAFGLMAGGFFATWRRDKDLSAWARKNHLSFSMEPYYGLDDDHPAFDCLRRGAGRFADNLLEGKWRGRSFQAFDYHYTTGDDHYKFSAIILGSAVPLKPLSIRPRALSDHVADFFGFDEIKFESAEFSRAFHVASPDRKWAYDVLHPRAMAFLLSMPRFEVQFDAGAVMVHRGGTFSARDFEDAVNVAQGLLDGLPEYVKAPS